MKSGRYTKEEYIGLFQCKVNINALYLLDEYCKNIHEDFLDELEDEMERNHVYIYSFFFFFNDFIKEETEKREYFCSSLINIVEDQNNLGKWSGGHTRLTSVWQPRQYRQYNIK
jgi:hypothetical protein